ncbi:hypothetical protein [Streptomyces sp. GbtcB7]|uniref:hypothetical protein n=1 Tax=Streptomyces sp. GbtcB7 TaxID=2824752 RepID=UPI0020C6980C|nr:hypothetical protein [Streptomyces sp. GbtcB7]
MTRNFRDGRTATWWAADAQLGWWGPDGVIRLVVATTDPATLPETSTWYLATNLPRPGSPREQRSRHPAADLTEVVRLYGLRHWVEQSYKHVKDELGWADFQVRSDTAIRRHQTLVNCAFSFCWNTWFTPDRPLRSAHHPGLAHRQDRQRGGEPGSQQPRPACWPQAIRAVRGWLTPWAMLQRYWRAWTTKPPPPALQELINTVGTGRPLNLYIPVQQTTASR